MDNEEKIIKRLERIEEVLVKILEIETNHFRLMSKYDQEYLTEVSKEHIIEG